ncbi:MAG: hypothetical protein Ct9H300mP12_11120 [Acidimicrobiales bacterium]|nr:MAG: hypothetical protein Ct9H300mP12_11120 [Acidimicrobiales bacterium]
MVRTTDGFERAEVDLELRGEGTIMGERQKGRNDLRLASLRRDREWVRRRGRWPSTWLATELLMEQATGPVSTPTLNLPTRWTCSWGLMSRRSC